LGNDRSSQRDDELNRELVMSRRKDNNSILVIADLHFPYTYKGTLDFVADTVRKEKVDRVVINGDLTDSYNFSTYSKSLGSDDVVLELKQLRKMVKKLGKIIPSYIITDSNHDARLWRKAKVAGIPREVLLPYIKLIGAEDLDWKLVPEYNLTVDATREQWHFTHHLSGSVLNAANGMNTNVVLSHKHTVQGIQRAVGVRSDYWGCDTGCLIDEKSYAFSYQKLSQRKPALGALLIQEGMPRILTIK